MIYAAIPVAHATGRGYVGPPGLNRTTSKSVSEDTDKGPEVWKIKHLTVWRQTSSGIRQSLDKGGTGQLTVEQVRSGLWAHAVKTGQQ